jgi:hypothetical protein
MSAHKNLILKGPQGSCPRQALVKGKTLMDEEARFYIQESRANAKWRNRWGYRRADAILLRKYSQEWRFAWQ